MGIISGIKNMVTSSLGYSALKKQTGNIKTLAVELITPQEATREETFEEALKRLNLTEEDIEKRKGEFKRLTVIFSLIGIAVLLYFVYALTQKAMIASLGSVGIFCVVLAQIFRYHFWLFQIRQRRLGCTFKEWLKDLTGKKV